MAAGEIFFEHERWGHNLAWSAILHLTVTLAIVGYGYVARSGRSGNWGAGGGGSAIGVSLVSNIPLPRNPAESENVLATESKGVTKSEAKPTPDSEAIPIQEKPSRTKPARQSTETRRKPQPQAEEADNVVPFGEGGPLRGPYSVFNAGAARGGFGFTGGGGDFASRFAWYVRVVNQKVSENWLKYEVDPRIATANRVYLTFDIDRGGRPSHVQIEQSSGVPSLDISALRALSRIDTFGPLPAEYPGSKVSVEFWFDYKR